MEDKFYWIKHLSPKLIAIPAFLLFMYDRPPEGWYQMMCFFLILGSLLFNVVLTWRDADKIPPSKEGGPNE